MQKIKVDGDMEALLRAAVVPTELRTVDGRTLNPNSTAPDMVVDGAD